MLHHGRRDINGVGRNGHTFAPSEFHLKVHYHLSFNGGEKHSLFIGPGKGRSEKRKIIKMYHLSA